MFEECQAKTINISSLDTSKVTDMERMFSGCNNLVELDLSNINTSNVRNMERMFYSARALKELDLTSFNTENVQTMRGMFAYMYGLESVDLSSFNTKNVRDFVGMFYKCIELKFIDISGFEFGEDIYFGDFLTDAVCLRKIVLPSDVAFDIGMPATSSQLVWVLKSDDGKKKVYAYEPRKDLDDDRQNLVVKKGTTIEAADATTDAGQIPETATFTVTSSDVKNPTVSFDGVSSKTAKAVTIPKTITYNGVTYKVTTVSLKFFISSGDKAKYKVTGNKVGSLNVEYKVSSNKKGISAKVPDYTVYKGIKFKVTAVAAKAFKNNKKLKQISIANSVTKIGKEVFYGCSNLKTVTIGKNLKTIGANAFNGCKNLKKITIKSTKLISVGKNALKGINSNSEIKVPKSKLSKYKKLFKNKGQKKTVKVVK